MADNINKQLRWLFEKNEIVEKLKGTFSEPERLYGFAEVHESDTRLTPVLSLPGSAFEKSNRWTTSLFAQSFLWQYKNGTKKSTKIEKYADWSCARVWRSHFLIERQKYLRKRAGCGNYSHYMWWPSQHWWNQANELSYLQEAHGADGNDCIVPLWVRIQRDGGAMWATLAVVLSNL